jgi:outer membrane protein W
MKKAILYSLAILKICYSVHAQVYMEEKTQHRFAQTYVGLNTQFTSTQGSFMWGDQMYQFAPLVSPRFTIGGLHFWGKWDFNMNIPLARFYDQSVDENTDYHFNSGGDLSARYYPWRMQFGKLRPYAGISINEMTFGFETENVGDRNDLFITSSLLGGISYAKNGWQLNAEIMWLPRNERDFYSSRSIENTVKLPKTYFSLGLMKYFDGTLHDEEDKLSGRTKKIENELRRKNKLNSFSVGIAPSGSYFLHAPGYENADRQSVPRHKGAFNWEFGLGYLFHDAGIHVGLAYRDYTSQRESYGLDHLYRRRSIALEALFFIWDYNGFAPFIGPSISYERWAAGEFENDIQVGETVSTAMIAPGIIFGWDILASPLETWVLRTNLRYYPFQKIEDIAGKKSRVDQFEFNFIELVLYPNRMVNVPRAKKRY